MNHQPLGSLLNIGALSRLLESLPNNLTKGKCAFLL